MTFDPEHWLSCVSAQPIYIRRVAQELAGRADRFGELQVGVRDLKAAPGVKPSEVDPAIRALKAIRCLVRTRGGTQGNPATWQLTYSASPVAIRRAAGAHHGSL